MADILGADAKSIGSSILGADADSAGSSILGRLHRERDRRERGLPRGSQEKDDQAVAAQAHGDDSRGFYLREHVQGADERRAGFFIDAHANSDPVLIDVYFHTGDAGGHQSHDGHIKLDVYSHTGNAGGHPSHDGHCKFFEAPSYGQGEKLGKVCRKSQEAARGRIHCINIFDDVPVFTAYPSRRLLKFGMHDFHYINIFIRPYGVQGGVVPPC